MTEREQRLFLGFARFFYAVAAGAALISLVSEGGFFRSSPLSVVLVIAAVGLALEWTVRQSPTVERSDDEAPKRPREPWLPPEEPEAADASQPGKEPNTP